MDALWVALSILFVSGQPSGMKLLGGTTEQACNVAREAELAQAKEAGLTLVIEPCWEAKAEKEDPKKPHFKKERDS